MRSKEEWARMIKNICMILVIFLLLGACSGQAAERGKREAPDHKSACQMVYADKKVRAQEVEKFIIENQKMPFQLNCYFAVLDSVSRSSSLSLPGLFLLDA